MGRTAYLALWWWGTTKLMNLSLTAMLMNLTAQFAEKMIDGMGAEEKKELALRLSDRLVSSLSPDDRKDLIVRMVPAMMDRVFEGIDPTEKRDLISKLLPFVADMPTEPPRR